MKNLAIGDILIADTQDARDAFARYNNHIVAAARRHPVTIGSSGVVFYDQLEYYPNSKESLE